MLMITTEKKTKIKRFQLHNFERTVRHHVCSEIWQIFRLISVRHALAYRMFDHLAHLSTTLYSIAVDRFEFQQTLCTRPHQYLTRTTDPR